MKSFKKVLIVFFGILICLGLFADEATAKENLSVVESYTLEDTISLYLKGSIDTESDMDVTIGTTEAELVSKNTLDKLYTLILIDNSMSIPEDDRNKIENFLSNFISDRAGNEQISIATIDTSITYLTDFTNDYLTLKQALDNLDYVDQDTYLTDVLYEYISTEYSSVEEEGFYRIIVISDGMDNKSIGYTNNELIELLTDNTIPVYTLGCSTGENGTELENMFALSRLTNADYFLLEDVEDVLDIQLTLKEDKDIIRIEVKPEAKALDGSKKAVRIATGDSSVTTEIKMPQQVYVEEVPVTETKEQAEEETIVEEPVVVDVEEEPTQESKSSNKFIVIIVVIVAVLVAVSIVIVVILLQKKKKPLVEPENIDEALSKRFENSFVKKETAGTEVITSPMDQEEGGTCMLWDNAKTYTVLLTDVNNTASSCQMPINNSLIIGRKKELSDAAFDYEKSVSGKHCKITAKNSKFYIQDLDSSNGTFINGSRIMEETEIYSGNIIKLGRLELKFEIR